MTHDYCNGACQGCSEKPEELRGAPMGMYHCPNCMMMLLAGFHHPTCDELEVHFPDDD